MRNKQIEEIIDETWSILTIRKQINTSRNLIQSVCDEIGNKVTNREKIITEVTEFYKNLYSAEEVNEYPLSAKEQT